MKYILNLLFLFPWALFAQEDPEALVLRGVALYDQGKYPEALKVLERARDIWPRSSTILYEIALTRHSLRDYEGCHRLTDSIIVMRDNNMTQGYLLKASALKQLGKTIESSEVLIDGIRDTGGDEQLFYNLGINFITEKKFNEAEICFLNAINFKPTHSSSYLQLAELNQDVNPTKALLAACQFLLLEPNSNRSKPAFELIEQILNGKSKSPSMKIQKEDAENHIIRLDSSYIFSNGIIRLDAETNFNNNGIVDFDYFSAELKKVSLNCIDRIEYKEHDVWRGYLIPFFADIFSSGFGDVFCNYIAQSRWPACSLWLNNRRSEFDRFTAFLKSEEEKK
ncbi:MAG TPA: hypothetical protein PLG24_10295 [Saprospiraceae bacterium]|nr:hypothetical protein [Saprospiraceae bacterium]